jgi:hypothetical protein
MAGRDIIGMYNELHTTEEEKQAALEAEKAAKVGDLNLGDPTRVVP